MIAAIAWSTAVASCAPGDAAPNGNSSNGLMVTVAVEPFVAVDSVPKDWNPNAFAESVTVRLAKMSGLHAYVGSTAADFTLRGTVTVRDGRTVIATDLWRPDENSAIWTGTFWRDDAQINNVVQDVAAGVAEALYGDIARRTLTLTTESR
jgi:TolB-like protein